MDVAAVIRPELEPERLVGQARAVEAAGLDELWLWEDCFLTGGIATSATALAATERIRVGLGIMPAPVRNPAFTAMEVAALARLHPGRFHAGLGHGVGDWMRQIGAKPRSQLTLLEETTTAVRALLRGETVAAEGHYVRLRGVALDHPPTTVPPVSLGVRGPKSLALSGRCADGTILDTLSGPAYVRWARERIGAAEHRITVFAYAAEDPAAVTDHVAGLTGPQADAAGPDPDPRTVAAVGTAAERAAFLTSLQAAGADCVVLVSPDPAVPLDLALRPG